VGRRTSDLGVSHPEERSDEGSLRLGTAVVGPALAQRLSQAYAACEILRFAQDDNSTRPTAPPTPHVRRPTSYLPRPASHIQAKLVPALQKKLRLDILPQPDDTTCGPTCLQAVYRYYGHKLKLERVIREVDQFQEGGTLAVLLGLHALNEGFKATIYTYNLHIFDPTWFRPGVDIRAKLSARVRAKRHWKLRRASNAYVEFLMKGGEIRFHDLTPELLALHLEQEIPVLTGLSATYLYHHERERELENEWIADDIAGDPAGHFVVLSGYNRSSNSVHVSDPYEPNPLGKGTQYYEVNLHRVVTAILLGVLTYDGNLLIIEPTSKE